MSRFILLCLLLYGLVLAGLASRNGVLLALALPLLVYLAAGLAAEPAEPKVEVSRSLSADRATPGLPVTVRLVLTNRGEWLEELLVEDQAPASLHLRQGQPRFLVSLAPGETAELAYELSGERGYYQFEQVCLTARESLGLFSRQLRLAVPGRFFILPPIIQVRRPEIRPRSTRVYAGSIPARQGGPGVEFYGVREYQPGDPIRWLNERANARHPDSLYINEFEQERVADISLILDARQQSNAWAEGRSLFEAGIQAAAALAEAFLRGGNRVGLFIYGRSLDWTFPGYGKVQRERILYALAQAGLGEGEVFARLEHLPTRLFPARSQLVLISPLLPGDPDLLVRLRARGYRLLVLSPNPVIFEQAGLAPTPDNRLATRLATLERAVLLRQLRHADIRVIDWPVDIPLPRVMAAAWRR